MACSLQGCATAKPVVYGAIGPETPHGYQDRQNPDGGFTVRVAMPPYAAPTELRAFFDRRADELCPAGVERTNVFRVNRHEHTAMSYGGNGVTIGSRVATGTELEGYVYCKPETDAPKA